MECVVCFDNENTNLVCVDCKKSVCIDCVLTWMKEKSDHVCPGCNCVYELSWFYKSANIKQFAEFNLLLDDCVFLKEQRMFTATKPYIDIYYKFVESNKDLIELTHRMHFIKENDMEKIVRQYPKYKNMEKKTIYALLMNNYNAVTFDVTKYRQIYVSGVLPLEYQQDILNPLIKCIRENCKGVIYHNYCCDVCKIQICNDCHLEMTNDHVCNQELVETVKQIMNDSKPCPTCFARISKVDGCDQMFCIDCKTAFSWTSGKVEQGPIHNPHYFELVRQGKIIPAQYEQTGLQPQMRNSLKFEFPNLYINIMNPVIYNIIKTLEYMNVVYHQHLEKFRHNTIVNFNETQDPFKLNYTHRLDYLVNLIGKDMFINFASLKYKFKSIGKEVQFQFINFMNEFKELLNESNRIYQKLKSFLKSIQNILFFKQINETIFPAKMQIDLLVKDVEKPTPMDEFMKPLLTLITDYFALFEKIEIVRHHYYSNVENLIRDYKINFFTNRAYFELPIYRLDNDKIRAHKRAQFLLLKYVGQEMIQ